MWYENEELLSFFEKPTTGDEGIVVVLCELVTLPALVKTIFSSMLISLLNFHICGYNVFWVNTWFNFYVPSLGSFSSVFTNTEVMSDEYGQF